MAGSLAEQLSAAVAAVELGGDNFKELVTTEQMYTGHSQGVPDELIKDRLIGEGGYSLVWLVHDEAEPNAAWRTGEAPRGEASARAHVEWLWGACAGRCATNASCAAFATLPPPTEWIAQHGRLERGTVRERAVGSGVDDVASERGPRVEVGRVVLTEAHPRGQGAADGRLQRRAAQVEGRKVVCVARAIRNVHSGRQCDDGGLGQRRGKRVAAVLPPCDCYVIDM